MPPVAVSLPVGTVLVEHQQFSRGRYRQRPEHDGIEQREDCRVRANSERERQDDHQRKDRMPHHGTRRVAHILAEIVDPHDRASLAMDLRDLADAAETAARGAPRLFVRQSLPREFVRCLRQVARDFVVELSIALPGADNGPDTREQDPERRHESFSEMLKKRSTILAARCHCASSL